jgi:NitT/TauT family transport system substrate-binding protein
MWIAAIIFWTILTSATAGLAAERFILMTPGPSVPYTPLLYGNEAGFFRDQGLDLQILAVRAGQVAVASLTSGEVDAITHAGTGIAAAMRGLPLKVILASSEHPNHELLVTDSVKAPPDLKGKSIGLGSVEGTGGIIIRRILQSKGLNPDKDVNFISMATEVRLQAMISGSVVGAMLTPPYTFMAADRGYRVFGRGKDYVRYLTEGVVTSDSKINQKRGSLSRFLKGWNRSVDYYKRNPVVMVPYIQKKFAVKDTRLAQRMYEEDSHNRTLSGDLDTDAVAEILEVARETMRMKEVVPAKHIFDFALLRQAN